MAAKKKKASATPETKHYVVLVTGHARVVVLHAESEEKAHEYALDELRLGSFEFDEARIEQELKTPLEVANAKRSAQAVAAP